MEEFWQLVGALLALWIAGLGLTTILGGGRWYLRKSAIAVLSILSLIPKALEGIIQSAHKKVAGEAKKKKKK